MGLIKRFFQFFKIDYDKLHSSKTEGLFWLDIIMIILILFNLNWIVFEYGFQYDSFKGVIHWISPAFYEWYNTNIHPRFFFFDLIFVAIFLAELAFRWIRAIVLKTYDKWFYYPFIHWYDVLGCVPLSSFRALRLFRLFAMVYRLQRLGIIDMTSTFIYKNLNKYLAILTEEVSDRVVINVLNGVQDEVTKGSPIVDKVINEVLLPRQHIIATWVARRSGAIGLKTFEKNEAAIRRILEDALSNSLNNNKELARLKYIPGVGPVIQDILKKSVTDITFSTIRESVTAFSDPQNNAGIVNDASQYFMESLVEEHEGDEQSLDEIIKDLTVRVLEIVKAEVAVQQWKKHEEERKQLREAERF